VGKVEPASEELLQEVLVSGRQRTFWEPKRSMHVGFKSVIVPYRVTRRANSAASTAGPAAAGPDGPAPAPHRGRLPDDPGHLGHLQAAIPL
jgi:hypothetical protein